VVNGCDAPPHVGAAAGVGDGSAYSAVAANLLQPAQAQVDRLRLLAAALQALHLRGAVRGRCCCWCTVSCMHATLACPPTPPSHPTRQLAARLY
jgi:hypothetical protein